MDRRNSKTFSEVERSSPFSPRSLALTGDNPKVTSGAGYWRHEKNRPSWSFDATAHAGQLFSGAQYLSQLDIRFIDIFSQSFERLYLLLYNIVYLALVSCCLRDYPPCFGPAPDAGRSDRRGIAEAEFNRETERSVCLYKLYFKQKREKIRDTRIGKNRMKKEASKVDQKIWIRVEQIYPNLIIKNSYKLSVIVLENYVVIIFIKITHKKCSW